MFDTIHINKKDHKLQIEDIRKIYNQLTKPVIRYTEYGESYSGNLSNLRIYISQKQLKIEGSICKFFFRGQNQSTLSHDLFIKAIKRIENKIGISLNDAIVTRLDIGQNMIMKHKVDSYFDKLVKAKRYSRYTERNQVQFITEKRRLVVYNKAKELKKNKIKTRILPIYEHKNLLRYEMRLEDFKMYLKDHQLTIEMLLDPYIYKLFITAWKEEFLRINKMRNNVQFKKEVVNDIRLFRRQLMLDGMKFRGGYNKMMEMSKQLHKEEVFSPVAKHYNINKFLKRLNSQPDLTENNTLANELELKVIEAADLALL